jgi:membrane protease YdiL (CAAX protease family)
MPLSPRTARWISLGAILAYWVYSFAIARHVPVLPATFGPLVLRIAVIKIVSLALVLLLLRLEGDGLGELGLTRRQWPRHLGIGIGLGLAMFVLLNVGLDNVMNSLIPRPEGPQPSIMKFFKQPWNLLAWLPIGIFGGGVEEELQRIFVLTRMEKWFGRPGLVLAVIMTSIVFGLGHLYQGVGSALSIAVSGLVFSLVYLRQRSALEPITAHAFSDVLAMTAATFLMK